MKIYRLAKYEINPEEVLDKLSGVALTFFDTETTGLNAYDNQITEIAAITVSGPNLTEQSRFHEKVELNEKTFSQMKDQVDSESPYTVEKLLEMTNYESLEAPVSDEIDVLKRFKAYVESQNSYIVAHNAKFDMSMVGTKVGPINSQGVWDTMLVAQLYYIPALKILSEQGDEKSTQIMTAMQKGDKVSSALGSVAQGLGISTDGWHQGINDVETTISIFRGMSQYIQEHSNIFSTEDYRKRYEEQILKQRDRSKNQKRKR